MERNWLTGIHGQRSGALVRCIGADDGVELSAMSFEYAAERGAIRSSYGDIRDRAPPRCVFRSEFVAGSRACSRSGSPIRSPCFTRLGARGSGSKKVAATPQLVRLIRRLNGSIPETNSSGENPRSYSGRFG